MQITLLQWNIWYKAPIEQVVEALRRIHPDIACLQELTVNSPEQNRVDVPNFLRTNLSGYTIEYADAHHYVEEDSTGGNAIITTFPVINSFHQHIINPGPGSDYSSEGRIYLEATMNVNDSPLTVGTTHMSYTHRFINTKKKITETDRLIALFKDHHQRFLFAGDLNSRPYSYTVNMLHRILMHCGPPFSQPTWTTKPFEYQGFREDRLRWRIDYVFATPDITVRNAEIVNEVRISDHLPILITLEWPSY